MPAIEVRPFRRSDREQLTYLVNIQAAALVPGVSVSVNTVMSQLEREPGEMVVDPWVIQRTTLVAEYSGRLVGAAHLPRYSSDPTVGEAYRNSAEIRWLEYWPERRGQYWPEPTNVADALMSACFEQFNHWSVSVVGADGALPAPGVYGVPEQWPHVRAAYQRNGFVHKGRTEIVYLANVDEISSRLESLEPPVGVPLQRSVGINGTRLTAVLGSDVVGYIEMESRDDAGRVSPHAGWADVGKRVAEKYRRQGIGTWLMMQAADRLRLGRYDRFLDYAFSEEEEHRAFLKKTGFRELTCTQRGWRRSAIDAAPTGSSTDASVV